MLAAILYRSSDNLKNGVHVNEPFYWETIYGNVEKIKIYLYLKIRKNLYF